jgi:hypothetical protein
VKGDLDMARDAVAQAIGALWDEGCPVAGDAAKLVPVILHRWQSSTRRGVAPADTRARTRDLVLGLIEQLEPEPELVGPLRKDYECVADRVVPLLVGLEAQGILVPASKSQAP